MSEERIYQEMILNAEQVLNELSKLEKAYKGLDNVLSGIGKSTSDFNKLDAAMRPMAARTQDVEKLSISMTTLSRVMETQMIVRAFNAIQKSCKSAFDEAVKYETKLAEIATISKNSGIGGPEQFGGEIRNLSDRYNLDLLDATKGLYDTVSYQISRPMDFMGVAAEFSKASVTSMADSVRLLSGTLNAYQLTTDQAEKLASQFNTTIELGAVTSAELANSFGRVAPRAMQLGVSVEELMSGFASLTIRGLKANEAATQLGGVFSGLVKPSEAMQAKLKELGFTSGEVAIKTLGLGGVLKALNDSVNGNAEAMGKLFGNVRGLSGAISIGAQANDTYNKSLKAIQTTATSLNASRAQEILSSNAQVCQKAFQQLSNTITVDLGNGLLEVGGKVINFANTFISVKDNTAAAMAVLAPLTVGLGAYAAAAWAGATANAAFKASLLGGIAGAGLIGEAVAGGLLIANRTKVLTSIPYLEEYEKKAKEAFDKQREIELLKNNLTQQTEDERYNTILRSGQQLNQEYIKELADTKSVYDQFASTVERSCQRSIAAQEKLLNKTKNQIDQTADLIQKSNERIANVKTEEGDDEFDKKLSTSTDKPFELKRRAYELGDEAAKLLSGATDQTQISQALGLFQKATSTGKQAGDPRIVQTIREQQIQAEKDYQANLEERNKAAKATLELQYKEQDRLKNAATTLKGNLSPFDKNADPQKRSEVLKTLNLDFDVEGGLASVQERIQAAFSGFKVKLNYDVEGSTPDEMLKNVSKKQTTEAKQRELDATQGSDDLREQQLKRELAGIAAITKMRDRSIERGIGFNRNEIAETSGSLIGDITEMTKSKVTDEGMKSYHQKMTRLKDYSITDGPVGPMAQNIGGAFDLQDFSAAYQKLQQLQMLQMKRPDFHGQLVPMNSPMQQLQPQQQQQQLNVDTNVDITISEMDIDKITNDVAREIGQKLQRLQRRGVIGSL